MTSRFYYGANEPKRRGRSCPQHRGLVKQSSCSRSLRAVCGDVTELGRAAGWSVVRVHVVGCAFGIWTPNLPCKWLGRPIHLGSSPTRPCHCHDLCSLSRSEPARASAGAYSYRALPRSSGYKPVRLSISRAATPTPQLEPLRQATLARAEVRGTFSQLGPMRPASAGRL